MHYTIQKDKQSFTALLSFPHTITAQYDTGGGGWGANGATETSIQTNRRTVILSICVYREALRWTLFSMQATGHVLLGTSYYMQHLIDEDEKAEAQLTASRDPNKLLQAIQWKRTAADHRN